MIMKKSKVKKIELAKMTITQIEKLTEKKIKGGTLPGSIPGTQSAHASQCGDLRCY